MKIMFHNRQRRYSLDLEQFQGDVEKLSQALLKELSSTTPRTWEEPLSKTRLKEVFADSCLSVVLISDRAMRAINKQFRGVDKTTDVLSFPMDRHRPPGTPGLPAMEAEYDGEVDELEEYQWLVGELYISVEKAAKQAEEYGHSMQRELAFLFCHGLLHVLGFDHESKAQEKEMFSYQNKILETVGIKR